MNIIHIRNNRNRSLRILIFSLALAIKRNIKLRKFWKKKMQNLKNNKQALWREKQNLKKNKQNLYNKKQNLNRKNKNIYRMKHNLDKKIKNLFKNKNNLKKM
jgi:hypothetical protein